MKFAVTTPLSMEYYFTVINKCIASYMFNNFCLCNSVVVWFQCGERVRCVSFPEKYEINLQDLDKKLHCLTTNLRYRYGKSPEQALLASMLQIYELL